MARLGTGIDVVLLTEQSATTDSATCEGFAGLPVLNPCLIIIVTDGSRAAVASAMALRTALVAEILRLSPVARSAPVPCGGRTQTHACHGLNVAACQKLLLLVSGGRRLFKTTNLSNLFLNSGPTFKVLPVLPRAAKVAKVLPAPMAKLNVAFWSGSIATIIPDILGLAALTTLERRIFISYRRADAQRLAEQLFDALTHARFEVFLDRFSVEPGVDFQRRLTEELAHKSMVLLLESRNILRSTWTTYEINYARQHRLGLLALHLPGGTTVPSLDPDERLVMSAKDFTKPRSPALLQPPALQKVIQRVTDVHGAALLRRRQYLRDAMSAALLQAGSKNLRFGVDGLLFVRGSQGRRFVHLTTFPPELQDFHLVGRRTSGAAEGLVVGPADALADATISSLDWLSGVSSIAYFDEGRILDVARVIHKEIK